MHSSRYLAALALLPASVGAQANTIKPVLTESDTVRLVVSGTTALDSLRWVQFVRNDADSTAILSCVYATARDSSANVTRARAWLNDKPCEASDTMAVLEPWSVTAVAVALPRLSGGLPIVGHALFAFHDARTKRIHNVQRALKVSVARRARGSPISECLVWGTLGLALVVALAGGWSLSKDSSADPRIEWNAKNSWASNAGIAGGIVTALLSASFLTAEPHYLAKMSYTILAAIFVALTALAPGVFVFVAKSSATAGKKSVIAASTLTLWGAFAQIFLASLLFLELKFALVLPARSVWAFVIALVAIALALALYAFRSIREMAPPAAVEAAGAERRAQPVQTFKRF